MVLGTPTLTLGDDTIIPKLKPVETSALLETSQAEPSQTDTRTVDSLLCHHKTTELSCTITNNAYKSHAMHTYLVQSCSSGAQYLGTDTVIRIVQLIPTSS